MAKKKEAEKIPEPTTGRDTCLSCNMSVVNDQGAVRFPCPDCGKYIIIRCSKCRKIVTKYECPNCHFIGPN